MAKSNSLLKIAKDYAMITVGCLLYAFTFQCFFQTNTLAMGGFTGIAQVLNRIFPALPVGTSVFIMNVPLMVLGVKKQGWPLLFASLYAIFLSSLLIDGFGLLISFPQTQPLLACLYGGLLTGISLGLMMLKNATTGGTELAARLLKYAVPGISIGKLCLFIDVTVICVYALTFQSMECALYGITAMYVSSLSMDTVVYGTINAKLAIIISDCSDAIVQRLMAKGLGGTVLEGRGAYTGQGKRILMCAARPGKLAGIKAAVSEADPKNAFMIVCDAREVFGEGFGEYSPDSL